MNQANHSNPTAAQQRRSLRSLCVAMLASIGAAAQAQTINVLINPGDQGEQSRYAVAGVWKQALERSLGRPGAVKVSTSVDASADLSTTRARLFDVYVAPAHVVGSAVRYGYTPVAALDKPVQAVLVAPQASAIKSLAEAAGKRLGLPLQDSIVTYLLRGELNAANTTLKRHFPERYETRYQDALLICLQLRQCDAVMVEREVFERWVAAGESLKAVMQTKAVPGLAVAVKPGSGLDAASLRGALASQLAGALSGQGLAATGAEAFDYVATLGYFTPRALPGATVVDAAAVQKLMAAGARYIDTRTEAEFKAGHVSGAQLLPYVEKSSKEADYKAELDQFDVAKLPADKSTPLIFACNGAECWKSFKASRAALKAGYGKVHWFRGGLPEWRSAGLQIKTQPAS